MYQHWRHRLYPPGVAPTRWLALYAEQFDCVEVNASFYRLPSRATFASWSARTPAEFRFAVKGSRFITHMKRLRDPAPHVERFFHAVNGLGDKLGPVLWQLPPDFKRDDVRLATFLDLLPRSASHAFEFRHVSWLQPTVYEMLRGHGVALCIPDHPRLPQARCLTAAWSYLRFHYGPSANGNYPTSTLESWAAWIDDHLAEGRSLWSFFNNDWQGLAVENARELRGLTAPR
jgi:uncharacterized protein YecE (DUF72 family)